MKVSEQIAIMKAYEDGKTIERTIRDESEWKSLDYVEDYPFDFVLNEYRIATEPNYRPYESVEEAFEEAKKHGFWIRHIDRRYLRFIDSFSMTNNNDIYLGDYCAEDISDMFVWHDDGSPCGIMIE